jgi:hypothetical protein
MILLITLITLPITIISALPMIIPVSPGTYNTDLRPGVSTKGFWSWNDYQYAVPFVIPYKVVVAKDVPFANFKGPVTLTFITPSGEFSRILLRVDIWMESALPGRPAVNYDRPIWVWIDGVPAYIGTTVERYNQTGFADVTHLYNLLVGGKKVNITIALPNWVILKWGLTGIFHVKVTLLYYPGPKPTVPDIIIPLFTNTKGTTWRGISKVVLNSKRTSVTQEINIPYNTVKAYLLVYTEGSSYEEFWYYNTPPDRYLIFKIDNRTVIAFLQPYPYIYTGGIDPLLWRPISSIRTYSFIPYVIDITPFIPLLIGKHNLTLQIYNILNYWHVFAALLIYTDPQAYLVTGKVLEYNFTGPLRSFVSAKINDTERYLINSTMKLTVKSYIEVYTLIGKYSYIAKASMFNALSAVQSYNNIWSNVTLRQYWSYNSRSANVTPRWASTKVLYSWSSKWSSLLDVRDLFYVKTKESPEHASAQHPVSGNFTLHDWIREELNTSSTPWPFTSTPRSFNASLSASAYINGTIMFISPTGAIITGISAASGNTTKNITGSEILEGIYYKFYRHTSGGNFWPHWWISEDKIILTIKEVR